MNIQIDKDNTRFLLTNDVMSYGFTLMETVVPSIVPLHLKNLQCPNWLVGMILSTIPNLMGMTIAPYISVKSDRCRSRWG